MFYFWNQPAKSKKLKSTLVQGGTEVVTWRTSISGSGQIVIWSNTVRVEMKTAILEKAGRPLQKNVFSSADLPSHLDYRARFALGRTFAGDGEEIAAGKSERRGRRDITEGMASAEHAARRRLDSPRPKSVEARRLSVMKVASVVEFALVSAADPPVSLKPSIGHRIRRRH
ncbi:hypothetical protein [Mesorhizobium sp. L2C084A000]|uniref:hypothetical protein n=1 Tax=unclassified Mesorhizobium TaxID=325217 RepID=UPI0012DE46E0|nr:hypothetical protein [Mesorhizobium sp. L2C084A000]